MSRTIRISDEVYAELQKRAIAFEDTPDSVLRREFGIDVQTISEPRKRRTALADLVNVGLVDVGEKLVGRYGGSDTYAQVTTATTIRLADGSVEGSPSATARAVTGHETNGMLFWHLTRPDDSRAIGELRG